MSGAGKVSEMGQEDEGLQITYEAFHFSGVKPINKYHLAPIFK